MCACVYLHTGGHRSTVLKTLSELIVRVCESIESLGSPFVEIQITRWTELLK